MDSIKIGYSTNAFVLKIGDAVVIEEYRRSFSSVTPPSVRVKDHVKAILGPEKSPYVKLESGRLFNADGNERGKSTSVTLRAFDEAKEAEHAAYAVRHREASQLAGWITRHNGADWLRLCMDDAFRAQLAAVLAPHIKAGG